jgi:UDP-N-acetylmuramoylalanine--D-glutamate ligase
MRHLQDQTVLILGLGASGMAMARWCARHGAHVTVADTREAPPLLATLREELPAVAFVGGAFTPDLVQGTACAPSIARPG